MHPLLAHNNLRGRGRGSEGPVNNSLVDLQRVTSTNQNSPFVPFFV